MDYLGRTAAPFDSYLWSRIDETVVDAIKNVVVGRRFLPFYGPLGNGIQSVAIDAPGKREVLENGYASTEGRKLVELPQLYEDFWLDWRDLEHATKEGFPADLSAVVEAAQQAGRREDRTIFYGNDALAISGLLTAEGTNTLSLHNWSQGEAPFQDVAAGVTLLEQKNRIGKYALVVSLDLYLQLERIQNGTGVLESERISGLLGGRLFKSTVLKPKTAVLLCCESPYVDLAVGQDFATAYLELVDLNHHLRILETATLRLKAPDAVVVYRGK